MNLYERGFEAGERAAFEDRKLRRQMHQPSETNSLFDRGFWDGYTPRSLSWVYYVSKKDIYADDYDPQRSQVPDVFGVAEEKGA